MTTIKNKTPEIYYSDIDNMDHHEYVKTWNTHPGNMDAQIKAYIVRDYCYNSNKTVKDLFTFYCKKLSMIYTDEQRIKYLRQDFLNNFMKDIIMDPSFPYKIIDIDPLPDYLLEQASKGCESAIRSTELHEENKDISGFTVRDLYTKFLENNKDKYRGDNDKYNMIMDLINTNASLYEIYNQFTKDELDFIGW